MKARKHTSYSVVFDFIGDPKDGIVNSRSFDSFKLKRDAINHWQKECKTRKKKDGNDAYWNAKPCVIVKTTIIEQVFNINP